MTIGILTMHRVVNYGSALQAYALQQALLKMGYNNELIDYEFPVPQKTCVGKKIEFKFRRWFYLLRIGKLFTKTKEQRFRMFRNKHLKISTIKYNHTSILESCPSYDIYMTGSDQVWNPRWVKEDTTFFLSFAPKDAIRLSYASSFSVNHIENHYSELYSKMLSLYRHITVREDSGIGIVKELTGKTAECVCDPTLLLSKEEYEPLVQASEVKINGPYILVYLLSYMYNPFPEANGIIANVSKELRIPVIYLDGNKYMTFDKSCKSVSEVGPCEFLWLFKHADFIITTSYHGVVFASVFTKPILAVISHGDNDDRMTSLLNKMGNNKSIVYYDSNASVDKSDLSLYIPKAEKVEEFRLYSLQILEKMLTEDGPINNVSL